MALIDCLVLHLQYHQNFDLRTVLLSIKGEAIKAWCEAGYQGVLEMATGSGKTIAAMICAHRLYDA